MFKEFINYIQAYGNIAISLFLLISVVLSISCNGESGASEFPDCFTGTYINHEGSGARSIWNFYKDGNFLGESSTQEQLSFSGQLSSWQKTGSGEATVVLFDFSFDNSGSSSNIARGDIYIEFMGENCEETNGSFELRFFPNGEDPFDLSSYKGQILEDTFTGRKFIF